jgi:hypothetical protein
MENGIIHGNRAGSNWLRKSGVLLDVQNARYMNYESILGLRSGEWKPLPKPEYILVFRTVYVKCEACSLEEFEKENRGHFQVSLINHQRRTIIHESKSSKEVFELAKQLSEIYHLPIRDSATNRQKPQWLNTAL